MSEHCTKEANYSEDACCRSEIVNLKDKLAEINERIRWRKQSEEPAPKTYEKVIWIRKEEYDCGGIFEWEGSICCGKCVPLNSYWRPLDLPDEVMAESKWPAVSRINSVVFTK